MRWQPAARWLAAVAGLGTAVVLYTQMRERPPADPPAVATPADPEATMQSSGGTSVRFRDGEVEISIEHEGELVYADGRTVWKRARIKMGDGTVLAAGELVMSGARVDGQPADLELRSEVEMSTPEGATIRAAEATYNHGSGVAILPGAVAFTRGRVSGGGTGGEYYRDTGVFNILAGAHLETAADDAGASVKASAESMTFNRATSALLFERAAQIAHATHRMTAERATLFLTEDEERFRVIELRGGAAVVPERGQEASIPEMRAGSIDLSFYDGTETLERAVLVDGSTVVLTGPEGRRSIEAAAITMETAPDGRTVKAIDARERVVVRTPARAGRPARTISSAGLLATGNDRGLSDATFDGGVRFVETTGAGASAAERTGRSQRLLLELDGGIDAVTAARFEQGVEFSDGEVAGEGDTGEYDAQAGRLVLRPARGSSKLPHVSSARVTVDAREFIDVVLGSGSLHARGDVKTVSRGAARAAGAHAPSSSGLLDARETVLGFAGEFRYDAEAGRARYLGSDAALARVAQGDTAISARTIDLSEQTEDLEADGRVDSTFMAAAGGAPKKYRVQAVRLEYAHGARSATYRGTPVVLTTPDGTTRAQTMVLTLAAEGRSVERLDARTDVHATMPSGREALSDSLLYEAAAGRYTLRGTRGRSLVLRAPGERPGTCAESRGLMVYFTSGGEPPVFPPDQNPGQVSHVNVACSAPLAR